MIQFLGNSLTTWTSVVAITVSTLIGLYIVPMGSQRLPNGPLHTMFHVGHCWGLDLTQILTCFCKFTEQVQMKFWAKYVPLQIWILYVCLCSCTCVYVNHILFQGKVRIYKFDTKPPLIKVEAWLLSWVHRLIVQKTRMKSQIVPDCLSENLN